MASALPRRSLRAVHSGSATVRIHLTRGPAMQQVQLKGEEERLRQQCEREASEHWPGARVLVDVVNGRYHAAVYLPEDGIEAAASAEQSELRDSPRDALEEVLIAMQKQKTLRSS